MQVPAWCSWYSVTLVHHSASGPSPSVSRELRLCSRDAIFGRLHFRTERYIWTMVPQRQMYELVQVQRRKFSPPRMNAACTIYSNVTYSMSYWQPLTVGEDDMASCFVQDLGLALVPVTCPHRPQAFKKVNDDQALPQENNICSCFVQNEPIAGTLRDARGARGLEWRHTTHPSPSPEDQKTTKTKSIWFQMHYIVTAQRVMTYLCFRSPDCCWSRTRCLFCFDMPWNLASWMYQKLQTQNNRLGIFTYNDPGPGWGSCHTWSTPQSDLLTLVHLEAFVGRGVPVAGSIWPVCFTQTRKYRD